MAADFNVRKMHNTVERMDGCGYFIKIIIIPLTERIAEPTFFGYKHTTPVKINTVPFKECMPIILSVTRTDTLLQ